MEFDYSDRCKELQAKLLTFMDEHIYPNEKAYKAEIDRNGVEKGNPADFQAPNPPASETTFVYPRSCSDWVANAERAPPAQ